MEGDLDSGERKLMDFEIMFSTLDFVDAMLPIRRQHIPVCPLQSLCDILKSLIELGCSGDVSALRDLTCSSEMSSTGAWIIRKRRRLNLCRHLLRWSALWWWRTILLIRIHYFSALDFSLLVKSLLKVLVGFA